MEKIIETFDRYLVITYKLLKALSIRLLKQNRFSTQYVIRIKIYRHINYMYIKTIDIDVTQDK